MNIFYPVIARHRLRAMFGIAILGATLAGGYGALHDQISYTISPEYFTKVKFEQFRYADFGWPARVMVSEVGFLASWWVGLIGGWILARVGLDLLPAATRRGEIALAFAIVFVTAIVFGAVGALIGFVESRSKDLSGWQHWQGMLQLTDLRSFIVVAYLHAASYLGAACGVIGAAIYVRRRLRKSNPSDKIAGAQQSSFTVSNE
jgi:hypothetical protein